MKTAMKTSADGMALIKDFEKLSLKAYYCPAGKLTIGWGHTGDDFGPKDVITEMVAEQLLKRDLKWAEALVNEHVTVPLTQHQFDAMVSIIFNVGPGSKDKDGIIRLKNGKPSTLLRLLNAGDYAGAAAQFPLWKKSGGKVLNGLVRRRNAEVMLWSKGSVEPSMVQDVDSPERPLMQTRTVAGATAIASTGGITAAVGVVGAVAPAIGPLGEVADIAQNNALGLFIALGIILCALAGYLVYVKISERREGRG